MQKKKKRFSGNGKQRSIYIPKYRENLHCNRKSAPVNLLIAGWKRLTNKLLKSDLNVMFYVLSISHHKLCIYLSKLDDSLMAFPTATMSSYPGRKTRIAPSGCAVCIL